MPNTIDYGNLMHRAMRGLIQQVLENVAKTGLPGNHHFFVTFDTMHPDVEIADWLSDRYPGEMTVVIQHWFANLDVTDEGFTITLNFGEVSGSGPYSGGGSDTESTGGGGGGGGGGNGGSGTPGGPGSNPAMSSSASAASAVASAADQVKSMLELQVNLFQK